ncbi:unnamed protein product [Didymodactylos carnosus]|uniref:protein-tyrosine-phosphatase n=1 Tax=Didymodactylos carnosus TaxID=1234261 RepID=A0A815P4C3_9BILA|nr:unnamed protein product [Didymodactylos carnosus]CAF1443962.1 unnamed protein product [Didymodactylos carnosus]CAF3699829.1 unnamed protein product [Didymodactylos carnosus]CAF4319195.1 unnamed protein product [Didymodactylos carnosus]
MCSHTNPAVIMSTALDSEVMNFDNVEYSTIVCLDVDIDSSKLNNDQFDLKKFDNVDQCINYISSVQTDQSVILVISYTYCDFILPSLDELTQIISTYIVVNDSSAINQISTSNIIYVHKNDDILAKIVKDFELKTLDQSKKYFVSVYTCIYEPIIIEIPSEHITVEQFVELITITFRRQQCIIYDKNLSLFYLDNEINSENNQQLSLSDIHLPLKSIILEKNLTITDVFPTTRHTTVLYVKNDQTSKIFEQLYQFKHQSIKDENKLEFPSMLSFAERQFIHVISAQLELHHQSTGKNSNRKICVSHQKSKPESKSVQQSTTISQGKQRKYHKISRGMSIVVENFLYLGSGKDANDIEQLLENKITHILNCTLEWAINPALPEHIKVKKIPLKDITEENISEQFDIVYDFLNEIKQQGGRVLIHCVVGRSRSASLVLSYLMKAEKMNLGEAYAYLLNCRNQIKPNDSFIKQLMFYEYKLYEGQCTNLNDMHSTSLEWTFTKSLNMTKEELNNLEEFRKLNTENVNYESERLVSFDQLEMIVQNNLNGQINKQDMGKFMKNVEKLYQNDIEQSNLPKTDFANAIKTRARKWYLEQISNRPIDK